MIVFIDSGVLGILANPNKFGEANDCEQWLYSLLSQGVYICSSELCDYEVRRSLVLASQKKPELNSIQNLDELREIICFLPLTSALLREAASVWASARSQGIPTADDKNLDVDIYHLYSVADAQERIPWSLYCYSYHKCKAFESLR